MSGTAEDLEAFQAYWEMWACDRDGRRAEELPQGWERYIRLCILSYNASIDVCIEAAEAAMLQEKVAPRMLWSYFKGIMQNVAGVPKVVADAAEGRQELALRVSLGDDALLRLLDGQSVSVRFEQLGIVLSLEGDPS